MIDYRVYLVTDDPSRYRGNWLDNVRAAVEGGVTCVQYRDTENAPQAQYERITGDNPAMERGPTRPVEHVNFNEAAACVARLNELTGETERFARPSPALEAGDPATDSSREPEPRGRRINLGCYGGTEWATGPRFGLRLIVR